MSKVKAQSAATPNLRRRQFLQYASAAALSAPLGLHGATSAQIKPGSDAVLLVIDVQN